MGRVRTVLLYWSWISSRTTCTCGTLTIVGNWLALGLMEKTRPFSWSSSAPTISPHQQSPKVGRTVHFLCRSACGVTDCVTADDGELDKLVGGGVLAALAFARLSSLLSTATKGLRTG